jgi:hypothetical protein
MRHTLTARTLDAIAIHDEAAFRDVAVYADLKRILERARYPFLVMGGSRTSRWDRALFMNLTYWGASRGQDVLADANVTADVVAHVAWHHLAAKAVGSSSVAAMLLGESIASAFDLYLVGRLLRQKTRSSFLDTQVPAMADAASAAGLSARGFERLLADVARDPERAFGDLRALLFSLVRALARCRDSGGAQRVLDRFEGHRFAALLHHYELSNWILFARCHARSRRDAPALAVDRALGSTKLPLEWLTAKWVTPALAASTRG